MVVVLVVYSLSVLLFCLLGERAPTTLRANSSFAPCEKKSQHGPPVAERILRERKGEKIIVCLRVVRENAKVEAGAN